MAIAPDQLAVIRVPKEKFKENKKGNPSASSQAASAPAWKAEFHRNDFLNINGPEISTDKRMRPTGEQEKDKVVFTEPLRAQVRSSLRNYVGLLEEIQRTDRTALEGQFHYHDRQLLSALVDSEKGTVADEKINEWLGSNAKHWEEAIVAMEHHASRTLMALGVGAILFPEAEKITYVGNGSQTVQLGIDQGCLNRVWNDTVRPLLTGRRDRTGGRLDPRAVSNWPNAVTGTLGVLDIAGSVGVGFLAGGPIGAAVGAALPFATMGAMRMSREGVVLHTQRFADAFQSILNDPKEVKFMSAVTGINLANYEVVGGNIQLRPNTQHEISKSPRYSMEDALKTLYTRQEFLTTLGIPYKDIDAMSEQFLFMVQPPALLRENIVLMEQNGLKIQARMYREFLNSNGYRDKWDQAVDNPYFGRADARAVLGIPAGNPLPVPLPLPGPGIPGFNPDNIDIAGNIQRWREARAKILEKDFKDEFNQARRKRVKGETIAALRVKDAYLEEEEKKRKQEHLDRKTALEADKTALSGEKTAVDAYRTEIERFRESREKQIIGARERLETARSSVRDAAGALLPDGHSTLAALSQILSNPAAPPLMIDGQMFESIPQRIANARTERAVAPRDTDPGGVPPGAPAGMPPRLPETRAQYERYIATFTASREEDYRAAKEKIDADVRLINEKMGNLRSAMNPSHISAPESLSETNQNVSLATKAINENQTDYAAVASWGLTDAQLRTETVDRLIQRINSANSTNNTHGWPKEQNIGGNRRRLVHAMTEARARGIAGVVSNPGVDFTNLTDEAPVAGLFPPFGGWNISEHQLLTLSADQINQLLLERQRTNPHFVALGMPPTVAQIEVVRDIARRRLLARRQAMEQMERYLATQVEVEDKAGKAVDLKLIKERNATVKTLMEGQAHMLESSQDMVASPETFFNTTLIDPADMTLTPAEKRLYRYHPNAWPGGVVPPGNAVDRYALGYLEFMNVIFKYRNKGNKDEAFKEASKFLPPDQLAVMLDAVVGPRMPMPVVVPRNNIGMVFADTQTLINNGTIGLDQILEALEQISNRLAATALAEAA